MRRLIGVLAFAALCGVAWAACDHPFFPVREGWVWSYRSSLDNSTYTVGISSVSAGGFVQRTTFKDFGLESRWTCGAGGLARPQYVQPRGGQGVQMSLQTRKAAGVMIPQNLRVGSTWSYSYEVAGEVRQRGMTMQVEQTVTTVNKVVAREGVSVPAGRFTAYRVESTMTNRGTMRVAGSRVPINTTVKTTSWYAQGVGLVKSRFEGGTTELLSLKR